MLHLVMFFMVDSLVLAVGIFNKLDVSSIHSEFAPQSHRMGPGGRLNKKDGITRYGNSHVKDKTS